MEQEGFSSSSSGEAGLDGWPLGLLPVNARLSNASASTTSDLALPSRTTSCSSSSSSSSSGLDSESTTSFFPEESKTLGSLIGIHSSSQFDLNQSNLKQRNTRRNNRHRLLCPFLGCGGAPQEDSLEASSSLSHLIDTEGQQPVQVSHNSIEEGDEEERQQRDIGFQMDDLMANNKENVHGEGWRRSLSFRPSLQRILQPSPMPSWSGRDPPVGSRRIANFVLGFCGKLS